MPAKYQIETVDYNSDPVQLVAFGGRFDRVEGDGVLLTGSGDTTLIACPVGQAIRLRWFFVSAGDTGSEIVLHAKWEDGRTVYKFPVTVPGIFAHSSCREGDLNEDLIVNLSGARNVYVNYEHEFYLPT